MHEPPGEGTGAKHGTAARPPARRALCPSTPRPASRPRPPGPALRDPSRSPAHIPSEEGLPDRTAAVQAARAVWRREESSTAVQAPRSARRPYGRGAAPRAPGPLRHPVGELVRGPPLLLPGAFSGRRCSTLRRGGCGLESVTSSPSAKTARTATSSRAGRIKRAIATKDCVRGASRASRGVLGVPAAVHWFAARARRRRFWPAAGQRPASRSRARSLNPTQEAHHGPGLSLVALQAPIGARLGPRDRLE